MRVSPWLRYHCNVIVPTLEEAIAALRSCNGVQSIYLCGGINGLSDAACKDWRAVARAELMNLHLTDPMARDYRGREDECYREIVEGDKNDICCVDALLINASRPSWGTAMEIALAHGWRKFNVAFMEAP